MGTLTSDLSERDVQLGEIVFNCLRAVDEGQPLDHQEVLARHPEFATELADFFAELAELHGLTAPLREVARAATIREDGAQETITDAGEPGSAFWGGLWARYLDGYELLEEIGHGGNGVVFKARHLGLDRVVALKMMSAGRLATSAERQRFQNEIRAVAELDHPNIVPIYEHGEHDGTPYFSMKLVGMGSLAERIAAVRTSSQPGLPPRAAVRLLATVARAVHYAHQRGILHRDLKPANILLGSSTDARDDAQPEPGSRGEDEAIGVPYLMDFSLAKRLQWDSTLTRSGDILGTPSYMAPEQAGGRTREITTATDVYGLGAVLYAMLTGRPPFQADTVLETLRQVNEREPKPPSRINPHVDRDLETICLKCLEKQPERRYGSARELADDLSRYLDGRSIRVRRATATQRAWRWCRRNPAIAGLLASVLLLIVAIAIVSSVAAAWLGIAARRSQGAERNAIERLFHASFAQAKASRGSGRMGQRHDTLKALSEAAGLAGRVTISPRDVLDMRAEAVGALALPDVHLGHEWEGNPPGTNGRAFDSNYERYALSKKDGEVTVRRVADDQVVHRFVVTPGDGLNRGVLLQFSPDDLFLAAYYQETNIGSAVLWDLERGGALPLLSLRDCATDWSFDESRRVGVIGTRDRQVRRFDLGTGRELRALDVGMRPSAVAVQRQGHVLAVAAIDPPVVRLFDLESGQLLSSLSLAQADERPGRHAAGGIEGLAWNPDGNRLATACDDRKIYVWDWMAGRQTSVLTGPSWKVVDVAFSHSGDLLASYSLDDTVRLWDHRTSTLLLTIPRARWVGFSRDDRTFTAQAQGTRLALCQLDMSAEFRLVEGHRHGHRHRQDIMDIQIHPGGRLLATAGLDGVRLWDMVTTQELAYLSTAGTLGILFEKDGTGLLTYSLKQLRRWPLELSGLDGRKRVRIGPPRQLLTLNANALGRMTFCGLDQARLAITDLSDRGRGVNLIDLEGRPRVVQSWRTRTADFVASSPDGRWVATGNLYGPGFQVWDTRRNVQARRWDTGGDVDVAFSPDGRWLVSGAGDSAYGGAECCFWDVNTWERGPSISLERRMPASPLAFSDDGRMLIVLRSMTEGLLLDPSDLRELARFRSRETMLLSDLRFSPDGGFLVAGATEGYIHVWDLRRIRARLADMHLDWDLPPIDPPPDASAIGQPLEVEIQLDLDTLVERANYFLEVQDYRRALGDLEEALARDPDRPEVRRALVSVLTNGPIAIRDLGRASELVRTALRHDPAKLADRGDLGMILYRQGRYPEAVASLEPAIAGHPGPVDRARWRIFLAMSQHRLNQSRTAQDSYHRARSDLADVKLSGITAEEFARLWAETDATLHVESGGP